MIRCFEPETSAAPHSFSAMRNDAIFPSLASSLLTTGLGNECIISSEFDRFDGYYFSTGDFFLTSQDFSPIPVSRAGEATMAIDQTDSRLPDLTGSQHNMDTRKLRNRRSSVRESKRQKTTYELDPETQLIKGCGAVKKSQKLGDKITALQQLVSPYGKTDTASVLREASVCIKSLHDEIRMLASPYLVMASPLVFKGNEEMPSLRERGLRLVPISSTLMSLADGEPSSH